MSNCKELFIRGVVPFNFSDDAEMRLLLGALNAPSCGYRITYEGEADHRPNNHGGLTTYYLFEIEGVEAVSDYWLARLVTNLKRTGAEFTNFFCKDMEMGATISLAVLEKLAKKLPPTATRSLIAAAKAISDEAGQMDPHTKPPVLISHDKMIALRTAINKVEHGHG